MAESPPFRSLAICPLVQHHPRPHAAEQTTQHAVLISSWKSHHRQRPQGRRRQHARSPPRPSPRGERTAEAGTAARRRRLAACCRGGRCRRSAGCRWRQSCCCCRRRWSGRRCRRRRAADAPPAPAPLPACLTDGRCLRVSAQHRTCILIRSAQRCTGACWTPTHSAMQRIGRLRHHERSGCSDPGIPQNKEAAMRDTAHA